MRYIKYLISILFFALVLIVVGESYIMELDNFYTRFLSASIILPDNIIEESISEDIIEAAAKFDVDAFLFQSTPSDSFNVIHEIYCTKDVENYFEQNAGITEKVYKSIFMGSREFVFRDFELIDNGLKFDYIYIIGSEENARNFKISLLEKYGGSHIRQGYIDESVSNSIRFICYGIIAILFVLTIYEINYDKKELIVSVLYGRNLAFQITLRILVNTMVYLVASMVLFHVLGLITHTENHINITINALVGVIIVPNLPYLTLARYDLKKIISNQKVPAYVKFINYTIKCITLTLTIVLISGNLLLIVEAVSFASQKTFWEEKNDFYNVKLMYRPDLSSSYSEEDQEIRYSFYTENMAKLEAFLLAETWQTSEYYNNSILISNKNALGYLKDNIKELKELKVDGNYYFFLPSKLENNVDVIEELELLFIDQIEKMSEVKVYYYDDNTSLVSRKINDKGFAKVSKNPVIFLDNSDLPNKEVMYYWDLIMFNLSESNFDIYERFIFENKLSKEVTSTNSVYSEYISNGKVMKVALYSNSIFIMLLLLFEISIIHLIIKLEFSSKALELSISKIMGYSVFERYKGMFMMVFSLTLFSFLVALLITLYYSISNGSFILFGIIITLIIETMIVYINVSKIERRKIQIILKGGTV